MTTTPGDSLSQRIRALIFNGITKASATRADFWMPLTERNRMTEAVFAELRAGNIEFRLGPLALLASATVADHHARLAAAIVRLMKHAADRLAEEDVHEIVSPGAPVERRDRAASAAMAMAYAETVLRTVAAVLAETEGS